MTFADSTAIIPVELDNSGFSVDAIWELGGNYTSDLSGTGTTSSYVLVSTSYAAANPDSFDPAGALPDDGIITTANAVFWLQPYSGNNVLTLNGDKGTLTLAPSAQSSYSEISLLVSSLSSSRSSSTLSVTLNYTNGPSISLTDPNPPTVPILTGPPNSDGSTAITLTSYENGGNPVTGAPIYLDEYDFPVSAPPGEILQSVTIDPGVGQLQVYAVSGVDPTPEPPTWLLLLTSLGVFAGWVRRARLSA